VSEIRKSFDGKVVFGEDLLVIRPAGGEEPKLLPYLDLPGPAVYGSVVSRAGSIPSDDWKLAACGQSVSIR